MNSMRFPAAEKEGVKWYKSVRFYVFLSLSAVFIVFLILFNIVFFKTYENYWICQRMSEVSRYATFVAGQSAMNETDQGTDSESQLHADLESINRLYTYMRILIIDDKGMVVQDTSQSRVGRYIINDEILGALAGNIENGGDSKVKRLAVPITVRDSGKTCGVVYVFASMELLHQKLVENREWVILIEIIMGIVVIALFYLICYLAVRPFDRINSWLKQRKEEKNPVPKPKFHMQNEFSLLADTIDDSTRDLLAMDRSRKEFVSNVSHELKTPLSSIKVLTESLLLQDHVPEEMYKEFLQDINSEIDRMTNIVNDLLTLVRLEEGGSVLNLSTFNLADLVDDILKRLKPLADQRSITLSREGSPNVQVEADATKLTLAISNLVQNGIKYNRDNGKVTVVLEQSGPNALISVSDTGIGIEEENFDKLFQRFYRVDTARDRAAGGTGLGLSIVRQIVTLHKGVISVSSTVGKGSTFLIKMPVEQISDQDEEDI